MREPTKSYHRGAGRGRRLSSHRLRGRQTASAGGLNSRYRSPKIRGSSGLRKNLKRVVTLVICSQLGVTAVAAAACCLPQHHALAQEQAAACPMHKASEETCSMSACPIHRAAVRASHHPDQHTQDTASPTPASNCQISCDTDDFSILELIGPDRLLADGVTVTPTTRHAALGIPSIQQPITREEPVLIQPPRG